MLDEKVNILYEVNSAKSNEFFPLPFVENNASFMARVYHLFLNCNFNVKYSV
jgi:hypothetical protein